jgi:hypothetical protein
VIQKLYEFTQYECVAALGVGLGDAPAEQDATVEGVYLLCEPRFVGEATDQVPVVRGRPAERAIQASPRLTEEPSVIGDAECSGRLTRHSDVGDVGRPAVELAYQLDCAYLRVVHELPPIRIGAVVPVERRQVVVLGALNPWTVGYALHVGALALVVVLDAHAQSGMWVIVIEANCWTLFGFVVRV